MKIWEIGRSIGNRVAEGIGRVAGRVQETRPLAADLLESEDAYLAVFDAPGVSGDDVQVRFTDGEVLVRMDRFREFYEGFEMRLPGRGLELDGRVRLPEDAAVNPEAATAMLKDNGTLQVHIPKRENGEETGATTVEIEDAESESTTEIEPEDEGGDTADTPAENPTPT